MTPDLTQTSCICQSEIDTLFLLHNFTNKKKSVYPFKRIIFIFSSKLHAAWNRKEHETRYKKNNLDIYFISFLYILANPYVIHTFGTSHIMEDHQLTWNSKQLDEKQTDNHFFNQWKLHGEYLNNTGSYCFVIFSPENSHDLESHNHQDRMMDPNLL